MSSTITVAPEPLIDCKYTPVVASTPWKGMLALVPVNAAKAATIVTLPPDVIASVTLQVAAAEPLTKVTVPTEHAPV
jgi:hypothetical protein|tara:strand:- start:1236 stop:1466 length:231 start_codon:yes stop_codon:yes gene_type:complete